VYFEHDFYNNNNNNNNNNNCKHLSTIENENENAIV